MTPWWRGPCGWCPSASTLAGSVRSRRSSGSTSWAPAPTRWPWTSERRVSSVTSARTLTVLWQSSPSSLRWRWPRPRQMRHRERFAGTTSGRRSRRWPPWPRRRATGWTSQASSLASRRARHDAHSSNTRRTGPHTRDRRHRRSGPPGRPATRYCDPGDAVAHRQGHDPGRE